MSRIVSSIGAGVALLLALSSNPATSADFSVVNSGFVPMNTPGLSWADFDRDGDLDLLTAGNTVNTGTAQTFLYRNNGNGTFTSLSNTGLPPASQSPAPWADYDLDGYPDVIVKASPGTSFRVYHNDQNGSFTLAASLPPLVLPAIAWGDYDNDGDPDLIICGEGSGQAPFTHLYRNNKNGTFTSVTHSFAPVPHGSAAWGDYDRDGDADLVMVGDSVATRVYRNDNNGLFTQTNTSLPYLRGGSTCVWGDVNNDGALDILATGINGDGGPGTVVTSYQFINNGLGTFTQLAPGMAGLYYSCLAAADCTADGNLDLVESGTSNGPATGLYMYYGNGAGTWNFLSGFLGPGVFAGATAWGDFDNDGRLDFTLSGDNITTSFTKLYHNDRVLANTEPTAPPSINTAADRTSVTLSWMAASDVESSIAAALTYSLRIGTSPGACDVMSADALPSGYRTLAVPGNVGPVLTWQLKRQLLPGDYYAAVQAVDNGLMGSPFSPETSFTLYGSHIVLPANASFGSIDIDAGSTGPLTVTMQNTGNMPLQISNINLTGSPDVQFAAAPSTADLPAASSRDVLLTFDPSTTGPHTATLSISTDDLLVPVATTTLSGVGLHGYLNYTATSTTLAYGNRDIGAGPSASQTVTIRNDGNGPLNFTGSGIAITGADASQFAFVSAPSTGPIPVGGTRAVSIQFDPNTLGNKTASLVVTTDDTLRPSVSFSLTGKGVTWEVVPSTTSLNFGSTDLDAGSSGPLSVTITNTGLDPHQFTGVGLAFSSGAEFRFASAPTTTPLNAAASTVVQIVFDPLAIGTRTDTLSIFTDDGVYPIQTVSLSGNGLDQEVTVTPTSRVFGNRDFLAGASASQSVSVKNDGNIPLNFTGPGVSLLSGTDFLLTGTVDITPVPAGVTRLFNVVFDPLTTGAKTDQLSITTDDTNESTVSVSLTGTGVDREIQVTPASANFIPIDIDDGATSNAIITVSNLDGASLRFNGAGVQLTGPNASEFNFATTPTTSPINGFLARNFSVTCNPTTVGSKSASLVITTDDADESTVTVPLTAQGLDQQLTVEGANSSGTLDFGRIRTDAGSTGPLNLYLRNTGNSTLRFTGAGATFTGLNPTEFSFSGNVTSPIAPGTSTTVQVYANPSASGNRSAQIYITTDDIHHVAAQSINVTVVGLVDSDGDGITDDQESLAPNNGDGNSDGKLDAQQANVTSLASAVTGQMITLAGPGGTTFTQVLALSQTAFENTRPPGLSTPLGLVSYTLQLPAIGTQAIVVYILPATVPVNSFWKAGATAADPTPHYYAFNYSAATGLGGVVSGNQIIVGFRDGAMGDSDLTADGYIRDPGAPAVVTITQVEDWPAYLRHSAPSTNQTGP